MPYGAPHVDRLGWQDELERAEQAIKDKKKQRSSKGNNSKKGKGRENDEEEEDAMQVDGSDEDATAAGGKKGKRKSTAKTLDDKVRAYIAGIAPCRYTC